MPRPIEPQDLVIHVLNVGFGDSIVIEFPVDSAGERSYGLVDCRDFDKTRGYLNKLMDARAGRSQLAFVCATHPHMDHISGIRKFLESERFRPEQFWDSGFHHNSRTYQKILEALFFNGIETIRVTSGWERYFGCVQVTALGPSIQLRNRYNTYGVDMNNASIVLRLEHHQEDLLWTKSIEYSADKIADAEREAGKSVVILSGDAEFDSWANVTQEFPRLERPSGAEPLVKRMTNYLACSVIKVAHHGSMHSSPLDVYEKMSPELAIVSTKQGSSSKMTPQGRLEREMFPHQSAVVALRECGTRIWTTDGSYERQIGEDGQPRDPDFRDPGTVVVVVPPGGRPRWTKLEDAKDQVPEAPLEVD